MVQTGLFRQSTHKALTNVGSGEIIMQKIEMVNKNDCKNHIILICRGCGQSSSFSWNFQIVQPTKTCFECGFVEIVENKEAA